MKDIDVLVGLPGCGKTSYAKKILDSQSGSVLLSYDHIREMIKGCYCFTDFTEELTNEIGEKILKVYLQNKEVNKIIIDDCILTNTSEKRQKLTKFIKENCTDVYVKGVLFTTPIKTCIERRIKENKGICVDWKKTIEKINSESDFSIYGCGFNSWIVV